MATLTLPDRTLAYQHHSASEAHKNKPGVLFLGGFASDMTGTKAVDLEKRCLEAGYAFVRFDYRGRGGSSDTFEAGSIGDWFDDTLQIFDRITQGPQVLVGSSMGGWMALLLARARPERVAALIGLAAAPDFTEDLVIPRLTEAMKTELATKGKTNEPGEGRADSGAPITQRLLDEARSHLVLREKHPYNGPVRLLQGQADTSVPWQHAVKIVQTMASTDVQLTLIKDGDHRLSRPQDLDLIWRTVNQAVLSFG